MKRITFVLCLAAVACLVAAMAGCGSGTRVYTRDQTSITASVGEQFIIELQSNATTGYQWSLAKPLDTAVIKKVGSRYIPPGSSGGTVGAGGVEQWTFQGVGKGTTTIVMGYSRPFEKGTPPTQTVTFDVTIN
jgi:inhibitor of cysteine peptidase